MEEYLDVCNPDGILTGEKKLKHLVHMDGDWHKVAFIYVIADSWFNPEFTEPHLLLQRRASGCRTFPEHWDVPAGHIDAGETPLEGAVRELREEVGIARTPADLTLIFMDTVDLPNDKEIMHFFATPFYAPVAELLLQEEEVTEARWVPLSAFFERHRRGAAELVPYTIDMAAFEAAVAAFVAEAQKER